MADIKRILEELKWSNGFRIPFANAENIKLEQEVERLSLIRSRTFFKCEIETTRINEFQNYLKRLYNEEGQNQNILIVQYEQLETEKSLRTITKLDKDNFNTRIKTIEKECQKIEKRKQDHCKTLKKLIQKLEKLKVAIEWDEQLIENYQKKIAKEEDDNELIKQFSREDKKKINDLQLKLQRLQKEEISSKQLIGRLGAEVTEMDVLLTRSIQLYRQMHNERTVFVRHWKETVQHLHERDKQIMNLNKEILTTEDTTELQYETLKDIKKVRENLTITNRRKELNLKSLLVKRSLLDEKIYATIEKVEGRASEKLIIKAELSKISKGLQETRMKQKQILNKISENKEVLFALNERIQGLQAGLSRLDTAIELKNSYIKSLEEIVNTEGSLYKKLETKRDYIHSSEYVFRTELAKEKSFKEEIEFQTRVLNTCLFRLKKRIKSNMRKLKNKKQIDYKSVRQLYTCQGKFCNINRRIEAENKERAMEKNELMKKKSNFLHYQDMFRRKLKDFDVTYKSLLKKYSIEGNTLTEIKNTCCEMKVQKECFEKHNNDYKKKLTRLLVQENILKLKLKGVEKTSQEQDLLVYEAKRYQLQLDIAMKERISQIEVNKKIFMVAKTALDEEHRDIKGAISSSRARLTILKNRYETLLKTFGKGEDGEDVTLVQIAIKSMQEKSTLQLEGDKLDNQIKQAEQEIIAMENTLKVVTVTNENYKKRLSDGDDPEAALELEQAEAEFDTEIKEMITGRQTLQSLQQCLCKLKFRMQENEAKFNETTKTANEKRRGCLNFSAEAECKSIKINRAQTQMKKLLGTCSLSETLVKDFLTYKLQQYNRSSYKLLLNVAEEYLETKPNINRYLEERNLLKIPCPFSESNSDMLSRASNSITSLSCVSLK